MSKSVELTCDCGCGETVGDPNECGWFVLSQLPRNENGGGDWPKLDGELHFMSIDCLKTWTAKAASALPQLQRSAARISPRGAFHESTVPGLYV